MLPITRKIIHIDMDCFYAAIEMRDNAGLHGKPVAVGGAAEKRGVLCTANYVARQYGVRSAMATAYAQRLCPELILLPVNMVKYKAIALEIRKIFYQYTNAVEPLSLDEAYLDVTHCQQQGSATQIAQIIREKIFQQQQLTASAGVAPNKFLAKVASDWRKPNGLFVIKPIEVEKFVAGLAVDKIPGVGKVTAQKLQTIGWNTCQELQTASKEELIKHFGIFGQRLFEYCRGIDHRSVEAQRVRKSVSVEQTFYNDLPDLSSCLKLLPDIFLQLQKRLEPYQEHIIKNQFVKIKFSNFIATTAEVASTKIVMKQFEELCAIAYGRHQLPIRLLGLGVHFADKTENNQVNQLNLDI